MLEGFRDHMRKRLPASNRAFKRGVSDIVGAVQKSQDASKADFNRLGAEDRASRERLETSLLAALESRRGEDQAKLNDLALSFRELVERHDTAIQSLNTIDETLLALRLSSQQQSRAIDETLWAEVFRDTIASSDWLLDKTFSPGRWAVGYPFLYVMYRVLNEVRPQRVLELGLGQSTRMMAQFAAAHDDVRHLVVEHDDAWIRFFSSNYRLPESTSVVKLDWDYVAYREAEGVRVYAGFAQALAGMQFDMISIDGPLGGDMEDYARIDVLGLLPQCLSPSFVILLDDLERLAEARTMLDMQAALSEAGVDHLTCQYSGSKNLGLLCSPDLAFLCSL